jgi:RNA polymerase sigma-70 factor (ECF subfamily)
VLRDVLGFHAAEVADMLDSSVDSVKAALKRARATLEQRLPATDRDRAPLANSPGERELVRRFADAFEADDIDGVVALLTEDAWFTMPPSTLEYQGRLVIASFLRENAGWRRGQHYRLVPTRANTQPAFATYRTDPNAPIAHGTGLFVLTLEGERIAAMTQFMGTSILSRFGFPRTLRDER